MWLTFSCGNDDGPPHEQRYPIQVIDGLSGDPIPNIEISLSYNFGSQNFDYVQGVTDQNGMVELVTHVNTDSVESLIDTFPNANPQWVHQNIQIDSDEHLYYEAIQDTASRIIRSRFATDKLITVKTHKPYPVKITVEDITPIRERSHLIWVGLYQSHPAFSFDYTGDALYVFELGANDIESHTWLLADEVDYRLDFRLTVYDTLNDQLDTLSVTPIDFRVDVNDTDQEVYYSY